MAMEQKALDVRGLNSSLRLKSGLTSVVSDLSFSFQKGEVFGVIGESGCGKSVSCYSILGMLEKKSWAVSGDVLLDGEALPINDPVQMTKMRGTRLSLIMQNPMSAFDPLFTIDYHFQETAKAHSSLSKEEVREAACVLLERMRIRDPRRVLRSYPFECSGGMLQRIMIAIALILRPSVLVADEPTTALDQTVQYEIIQLLGELREGGTGILIISHDLNLISGIADRIGVMYGGYMVEKFSGGKLREHQVFHPYTQGLLGSRPSFSKERLPVLEGTPPTLQDRRQGCPFYPRCKEATEDCLDYDMSETVIGHHAIRCLNRKEAIASCAC